MTGFHPEAMKNFDEKASEILAQVAADQVQVQPEAERFRPDLPISGHLTDADIKGPITQRRTDGAGQEIARAIACPEGMIQLEGPQHTAFLRLGAQMHQVAFMRDSVALESLLGWLGEWMLARRVGHPVAEACAFVSEKRAEAVHSLQCLVPLCEPYIQSPFSVGQSLLRPLLREELEEWFRIPPEIPTQHIAAAEARRHKQIKTLQARTVVVVDVEAEAHHAADVSWARANLVASALRLFSKGSFYPKAGSNCVPLGLAVHPKRQFLMRHPDGFVGQAEALLDPESLGGWSLSDREIRQDGPYLSALASLFDAEHPSAFQRDLLRSVLLYSRAAMSREVPEKLVHIFAAVESLLLRSENEPVQSSISERLAFVVGPTPEARSAIAAALKRVYGLRSKFVHHGRDPDGQGDLNSVKELQMHVWAFFYQVVGSQGQFATKDDFLNAIERRKWQ